MRISDWSSDVCSSDLHREDDAEAGDAVRQMQGNEPLGLEAHRDQALDVTVDRLGGDDHQIDGHADRRRDDDTGEEIIAQVRQRPETGRPRGGAGLGSLEGQIVWHWQWNSWERG